MAGPLTWWANRKSRLGLSPAAKKPPHRPGKEWWTDPPTTIPQPEHMEYVARYQLEVLAQSPSETRNALLAHIGAWWRAARQVLHEEMWSEDRADLTTTDGICIAAEDALRDIVIKLAHLGVKPDDPQRDRAYQVLAALQHRNAKCRRARAVEAAKRR